MENPVLPSSCVTPAGTSIEVQNEWEENTHTHVPTLSVLRKKEHKSYFGKNRTHDFRTSRCAGYLLNHSGDEDTIYLVLMFYFVTNDDAFLVGSSKEVEGTHSIQKCWRSATKLYIQPKKRCKSCVTRLVRPQN